MKNTLSLWSWCFLKVPMIFSVKPWVFQLNNSLAAVYLPFFYFNKNHIKSMYMGSLVAAADITAGLFAMHIAKQKKCTPLLVFKDVQANFIKRAEAHTLFICKDKEKIEQLIEEALSTNKRCDKTISGNAYCPKTFADKEIAEFKMTLSIRATAT